MNKLKPLRDSNLVCFSPTKIYKKNSCVDILTYNVNKSIYKYLIVWPEHMLICFNIASGYGK